MHGKVTEWNFFMGQLTGVAQRSAVGAKLSDYVRRVLALFFLFLFVSERSFIALCYAIVLPGRKSAFRAIFWPDCYLENTEIGPQAGLRPA